MLPGEHITAVIPIREFKPGRYLLMATKKGMIKKTPITDYQNIRKNGLAAITLRDEDELIEVKSTNNKKEVILVSNRFRERNG